MTQLAFMQFSIIVSVDAHIGYDLPFLPHRWVPFWGGSIKHDMHHQRPLTNFAPFYNWWDQLFGTYCPGQNAGGYKSKALVDWEKKKQQQQNQNRKSAAVVCGTGKSSENNDDVSLLGTYVGEPMMEAKRL